MLRNAGSFVAWGRNPEPLAPAVCSHVSDTPVLSIVPLHLTLHVCPPACLSCSPWPPALLSSASSMDPACGSAL